jgi:hypothetical protein
MARQKPPGRPPSRRSPHQAESRPGARSAGRTLPHKDEGGPVGADGDMMRQAECAAMLIAVTRMLLNLRGSDFAVWLRSIADDFEATDPDHEDPEDLSDELIRMGSADAESEEDEPEDPEDLSPPGGMRRPH